MDKFMNGNIRFEMGIQAHDGIHDRVEKNEYESTNVLALALVGASVGAAIVGVALLTLI